jgi:uncharacterized protein (DUF2141 family)
MRRAPLVLASLVVSAPALGADLAVTLTGIPDDRGRMVVGVCTAVEFGGPLCRFHAAGETTAGTETLTVRGIVPGTYAVAAYQDVDDSGHLKTGFFGAPTEPVGFSRDPKLGMHKPRFAESAIVVPPSGGAITLRMQHY